MRETTDAAHNLDPGEMRSATFGRWPLLQFLPRGGSGQGKGGGRIPLI